MPFAAALSEHPVTAFAVGEACGQLLETIGPHPDVVVVFSTLPHAGALEDSMATVGAVLEPSVIVGAASDAVIATGREVEGGPAISLWAGRWGPVVPIRLEPGEGLGDDLGFEPRALVVMGDAFSFDAREFLERLAATHPGLPVVGGLASGARGPGGTRLGVDGRMFSDGAVGLVLGPGADVVPIMSQGARPIGTPLVVTGGAGRILESLAGRTALERLDELAASLTPQEIAVINDGGLQLGQVLDERRTEFGAGDFVVRAVVGGDRETGAIAIEGEVTVGTTVQFHIRDATGAHEDLDELLVRDAPAAAPDAALMFTCNGRGRRLFSAPDHDAALLADRVGAVPTAGMFVAGEIGPVAGRNELRSFSASLLLVRDHH